MSDSPSDDEISELRARLFEYTKQIGLATFAEIATLSWVNFMQTLLELASWQLKFHSVSAVLFRLI